jgi:hypothetical protein
LMRFTSTRETGAPSNRHVPAQAEPGHRRMPPAPTLSLLGRTTPQPLDSSRPRGEESTGGCHRGVRGSGVGIPSERRPIVPGDRASRALVPKPTGPGATRSPAASRDVARRTSPSPAGHGP